jgi:type II secretory pathway component PulF
MPFGLDFKSIIVGVLLAYFVVPRILALFSNAGTASPNA